MSFEVERLYALLPALYRLRDDAQGKLLDPSADGGPIKELLTLIAREYLVIDENIDQLYDDMFVETAAEWVVPYIGDLLGVRGLYGVSAPTYSQRAYVANTIAYRRRKGTAAMLEQLAHDVTGWNANVVEFFQRLATTQRLNHLRPTNLATVDLRQWEPLERIRTPFDALARTVEVRKISSGAGKYNIPNIGVFLWRLDAFSLTQSPAVAVGNDGRRWRFSPLGENRQLFTLPQTEDTITHLAEPINVPVPISRRVLDATLGDYYSPSKSLCVYENGQAVMPDAETNQPMSDCVQVCDLSDLPDGSGDWAHMPPTSHIAVDPVLGRVAFRDADANRRVAVTFHYGFSMEMGGGEYNHNGAFAPVIPTQITVVGSDVQGAIDNLPGSVSVEIPDSARYTGALSVSSDATRQVEIHPKAGEQPILDLGGGEFAITLSIGGSVALNGLIITNGTVRITGTGGSVAVAVPGDGRWVGSVVITNPTPEVGDPGEGLIQLAAAGGTYPFIDLNGGDFLITLDNQGQAALNGLRIAGGLVRVAGNVGKAHFFHCTLVPGRGLNPDGSPTTPGASSLAVEITNPAELNKIDLEIDHCITGALRFPENEATLTACDTIIDATAAIPAIAANDSDDPAGDTTLERVTVFGKVSVRDLRLASDCLFTDVVYSDRLQDGCVRYSLVPTGSQTPRRYQCVSDERLVFTSTRYGDPGFGQLSRHTSEKIRAGADDEAEMGAFHDLYQPQRETNLRVRLDEFLRFGLEAGIFYAT